MLPGNRAILLFSLFCTASPHSGTSLCAAQAKPAHIYAGLRFGMSQAEVRQAFVTAEAELECGSRTFCSFKRPPTEIDGVVGGYLRFGEGQLYEIGLDFTDADFVLEQATEMTERDRTRKFEGLKQRLMRKYGALTSERAVRLVPAKKRLFGTPKAGPLARQYAWWRDGDVEISLSLVLDPDAGDAWRMPEGESALTTPGLRLYYSNEKIKARQSEKL